MDVDPAPAPSNKQQPEPIPEVDVYFRLLILHHLLTSPSDYPKATQLAHETVDKMQALNRRSMDPIAAKIWYAVERTYELSGKLADTRPYVSSYATIVACNYGALTYMPCRQLILGCAAHSSSPPRRRDRSLAH